MAGQIVNNSCLLAFFNSRSKTYNCYKINICEFNLKIKYKSMCTPSYVNKTVSFNKHAT